MVCRVSRIRPSLLQNLTTARNQLQQLAVINSVQGYPRVMNERDLLGRFQHCTPYLRPIVDEIKEPSTPVTIVLNYLQADLLRASIAKTLNRRELKYVSRCVLEALMTLHEDGFVHTGIILA
jgi:serine/threonine protein kinase